MTTVSEENGFINVVQAGGSLWPSLLPPVGTDSSLQHVWVQVLESDGDDTSLGITTRILFDQELALSIPGLDAVALTIAAGAGGTIVPVEVQVFPDFFIRLSRIPIALRLKGDLFKPVKRVNPSQPNQPPRFERDTSKDYVEIVLAEVSMQVDGDGNITLDTNGSIDLPPCMISDSGIVIEATDIGLYLDATSPPPGKPAGWRGLHIGHAGLYLPGELASTVGNLELTNAYIGNGGFSGQVSDTWTPALLAQLFGITFSLKHAELAFVQNVPTKIELRGEVVLPFFQQPVGVDLGLGVDGSFQVGLSTVQPAGVTTSSGLITFERANLLRLTLDSVKFEEQDGVFAAKLSGKLKPLVAGIDWPEFDVRELSIDSNGNVRLEGGWMDLPSQYSLDFHGFQIEITKLGFGKTEDGGKWIGFSGGLKLVDGLPAGASVEGLRITWYEDGRDTRITLNGVGVEFLIPGVLKFKGAVSYRELTATTLSGTTELVHRFDGDIKLELISLDMQVDATLVVGSASGPQGTYTFFAIYLAAELPAGIPLAATGLALYGMAGLFALQMEPDKRADEEWYSIGGTKSYFHRPTIGVTDLARKWRNQQDSLALGAGVTIGTLSDNGFTFSGRVLLAIVFPGPILLIEGQANLLKERSKLDEEPLFRALAVLDNRAGTFLIGLDAQYKFGSGGELVAIRGGVEAFFSFRDASLWHLYLGEKEPREKRIRAEIFRLFEANAYFMLDARQLAMGAWVGYAKQWRFGPLSVAIEAWIESNAIVSFKPAHFYGDLWLHGMVDLRVFRFGLGLTVDARIAADVFDPFHVLAELSVGIKLPRPLRSYNANIRLEWGPTHTPPPLPLPLKEIAVEHFKVTTSWPLPRGGAQPLLLPNYDGSGDGFLEPLDPNVIDAQEVAGPPANVPVVPLDCRPHITFGRPVHDDALVSVNPQPVHPGAQPPGWEWIGDPAANQGPVRARYALKEISLFKRDGATWQLVARKGTTLNPAGVRTLYGSWAPVPQLPEGRVAPGSDPPAANVKLWLWSKSAFDYTRHSGGAWDEWFTGHVKEYPCVPIPQDRELCCDFEKIDPAQELRSPWQCPEHPQLLLSWRAPRVQRVTVLAPSVQELRHCLCFAPSETGTFDPAAPNEVTIHLQEAAKNVQILLIEEQDEEEEWTECVSFRDRRRETGPNPRIEYGVTFEVRDFEGNPQDYTRVFALGGGTSGLDCGHELQITLSRPASFVELTLTHFPRAARVEVFDADGASFDTARMRDPQRETETLRLEGEAIEHVVVRAPRDETLLHEICFGSGVDGRTSATGFDRDGEVHGPFFPQEGLIEVAGPGLTSVHVKGRGRICILRICATIGLDATEVVKRQEMAQHLMDEMARWSQEGEVLESHTIYRLKTVTTLDTAGFVTGSREQTEFAYFRTDGPPGLTALDVPIGHPKPAEFDSGLNDLVRYVRQTVPATVPAAGEKPSLPRPVYRAYDVGTEFNENYVDLMYRLERRDLGLYLYDNNNRPVRDARGRLIVLSNRWGKTEELTLTESEWRWISVVNESDCADIDTTVIPHDKTLTSAAEGQVLDPDTVYEARLVPLLLHEDFARYPAGSTVSGPAGALERWFVRDEGTNAGPSRWEVRKEGTPPSRYIIQTSDIWGGTLDGRDPVKPGTLLLRAEDPALPGSHPEQPGNWTDYRLNVYLRSTDDDAIGVVFRYHDANNYYRFSMDHERKSRTFVRVFDGIHTVLAEDDFVYRQNQDYLITVEAIGPSLRVYQDGALVFGVTDASIEYGRIGLYCWGNTGARFSDVRVDDFRPVAPVVYRFEFTTSGFANFFHHLHSFQDETWRAELADPTGVGALVAQAAAPATPLSEAEARAYEALAMQVLGPAARQDPPEVQVTRVEHGGEALAFLVRSPEPIDWKRTGLEVLLAQRQAPSPELPGAVKLTDAGFGTTRPNEESVTLLLREATDLTAHRVEYRRLPGPVAEPIDDPMLFVDEFEGAAGGLLFREEFGPNTLDHYAIVDEGTELGPSSWTVSGGHILQTSNIYGGSVSGAAPDKPGTIALTGSVSWANVRVYATLRSEDDDAIGIVFRYQDANNYYRFYMDRERSYRRLVKKAAGVVGVLWEDNVSYDLGQSYRLEIEALDDRLQGYLDDALLFSVQDRDVGAGRVGYYCWANSGAHFEALAIEALEMPLVLWQPAFADPSEVEIVDETGAIQGPSDWTVQSGVLTQSSNIHVVDNTPHRPGTYALSGSDDWQDVQISVRLRSDDGGAIGVMFRVIQQVGPNGEELGHDYYRFSMDRQHSYRRLIKKVGDTVTVLWQDTMSYTIGQGYELTLRATGSELRGYLDGVLLFTAHDGDLERGRVGFYCSANPGARFDRVLVANRTRRVGSWTIHDEGTASAPSVWRLSNGALVQTSNISGGGAPDYPGTHAVAGDPAWSDYRLAVQLRSDQDDAIGVIFRYVDDDNYYRLSLDAQRQYRRLVKKENGLVTTLWQDTGSYTVGEPFTLTVDSVRSRLVGYQDDTRLFDVIDGAHNAGRVGLYCWGNTAARFERVEVSRPPLGAYALLRDRFSAGDVTGWSFVDEGTAQGPSNWTTFEGTLRQTTEIFTPPTDRDTLDKQGTQAVAGDPGWSDMIASARLRSLDDAIGLLFRYTDTKSYYRISMDSQWGYCRLVKNVGGTFTLLWEDDFAFEVGRTYEVTVMALGSTLRGYLDGVPMFVVEDGDLPAGQIGLYCWGNTDARFSQVRVYPADLAFGDWLLDESFDVPIPGRWNFVDEGDQEGPSQWDVVDGELWQTSNIHGGSDASGVPDKPGTYALAGDATWTDYRVSVRLRSEDGDAIGIVFRNQGRDNYYRFSMDGRRSLCWLIKKVAGTVKVLWQEKGQFTAGREYVLTLDCVGKRFTGYLDGVQLFTVEDSDLAAGRIGLYCRANPGARFAEVRVAAPAWTPYYRFGQEERLPAGTRMQVYAGGLADAPAEEPGIVRRFIPSLGESEQLRLPANGADLRLVDPEGVVSHTRHFLPQGDYAHVDARVLRKADGTGFFVVVPTASTVGSHLTDGQYRLKLAYRRDNRAAEPASQVLSEAGNSAPEHVMIDIPYE